MQNNKYGIKKVFILLLAFTMMLSFTACASKEPLESGNNDVLEDGNKDSYDDKVEVSIAVLDNVVDDEWSNDYHQYFMNKFNIEWDYNYVDWGSWGEKLRVWISSGDLPDVSIWDYNYSDLNKYVEQELLYKFPDGWKEKWPNVAKAYSSSPLNIELEDQFDGTYALLRPIFVHNNQTDPIINQIGVIGIRKDWAEAVGFPLKDAYTVDETLEYARLIKENDPGEIGNSLIPMSYDPANALTALVSANADHSRDETAFYKDENNEYKWGPAERETLEALKIYQNTYKEGLLDPEFYLFNDDDKDKFYINGTAALYHVGGVADFRQTCDTEMRTNLSLNSDDVVHEAIVLGNDEKYHNIILGANYWSGLILSPDISEESFERFMDFLDYTCTPEGQIVANIGMEDVDWEYDADGKPVSILSDGTSVLEKYGSRIESMYILEDDFAVINPAIKDEYRERMNYLAQLKLDYGQDIYQPIDWDMELFTSKEKDQAKLDYKTEYANLILQSGDLEANWAKWVKEKQVLIQPYLDQLNGK